MIEGTKKVHPSVSGFQARFSKVGNRLELLVLERDLTSFLRSDEYATLSEEEKVLLDDIAVEVLSKKEYYKTGCDPWKSILKRK